MQAPAQQMPPPPTPPWTPFDVLPCDDEPAIAALRHQEFVRAMAQARFGKFSKAWQGVFTTAYLASRKSVPVMTVAEHGQQVEAQRQKGIEQERTLDTSHEQEHAKGQIAVEKVKIGGHTSKTLDTLKRDIVLDTADQALHRNDPPPTIPEDL